KKLFEKEHCYVLELALLNQKNVIQLMKFQKNNEIDLWQIINMDLTHNHLMIKENHRFFMYIKQNILDDVKQQIELLHQAGVDVPTICAILKEEFEGSGLEKRQLDAEEFVKILDQFKYDDAEFCYYVDINEDTKRLEEQYGSFLNN
ncbi:12533_t:CDS:2, partial [Dentiscutata heterogama]